MTHGVACGFEFTNKLITIQKAAKHEICIKKPPAVVTATEGQHYNIFYCQLNTEEECFCCFQELCYHSLSCPPPHQVKKRKLLHIYCLTLHGNSREVLNELNTFEF